MYEHAGVQPEVGQVTVVAPWHAACYSATGRTWDREEPALNGRGGFRESRPRPLQVQVASNWQVASLLGVPGLRLASGLQARFRVRVPLTRRLLARSLPGPGPPASAASRCRRCQCLAAVRPLRFEAQIAGSSTATAATALAAVLGLQSPIGPGQPGAGSKLSGIRHLPLSVPLGVPLIVPQPGLCQCADCKVTASSQPGGSFRSACWGVSRSGVARGYAPPWPTAAARGSS